MPDAHAQLLRTRIGVRDNALVQCALRHADAGARVRDGACRQALRLQKLQSCNTRQTFAYARIVEHAKQRLGGGRITRRADAAMRAADRDATFVSCGEFSDGVDQTEGRGHIQ